MNMNPPLQKIKKLLASTPKYAAIIAFLVVAGVYIFIVLRIQSYGNADTSSVDVSDKYGNIKQIHIDNDSIKKIQDLSDSNIEVKALFDQARQNPFKE